MPPSSESKPQGRPAPMWLNSERGRYWVRMASLVMLLLAQLLRTKSTMRYWPPKTTAGLARCSERMESLSP